MSELTALTKEQLIDIRDHGFCFVPVGGGMFKKITLSDLVVKTDEIEAFEKTEEFKRIRAKEISGKDSK